MTQMDSFFALLGRGPRSFLHQPATAAEGTTLIFSAVSDVGLEGCRSQCTRETLELVRACRLALMPMNVSQSHFVLVAIDADHIYVIDPLRRRNRRTASLLRRYFRRPRSALVIWGREAFRLLAPPGAVHERQRDGVHCGTYVCKMAWEIATQQVWTGSSIGQFRVSMNEMLGNSPG